MTRRFVNVLLATVLAVPLPALAFYHERDLPGRSEVTPRRQRSLDVTPAPTVGPEVSPTPRPEIRKEKLRRPQHARKFERFRGIVNGMTNKLQNLSERLGRHLRNFERRITELEAAGRALTVDSELAAARAAVGKAQASIADILTKLGEIPDSETPRQLAQASRGLVRDLHGQIREARAAFQALREAIRDDVRASRPSPSPSPFLVSPSPSPTLAPDPTRTPTTIP